MKKISILAVICALSGVVPFLAGCVQKADPSERGLLPGECLRSDSFRINYKIVKNKQLEPAEFKFAFALDMASEIKYYGGDDNYILRIPPMSVYDEFGERGEKIKNIFENSLTEIFEKQPKFHGLGFFATVFYDEGMTFTADKTFAGHPAGENLIPYCIINGNNLDKDCTFIPASAVYLPLGTRFEYKYMVPYRTMGDYNITFSCEGHEVVGEEVTFTWRIPVKVAMFLRWLDNQLEDPDAEMPFEERVLQGTVKLEKGLH